MMDNRRQSARRQIDATILDLMKGIEHEGLGKPEQPPPKEPIPTINIGTVNVYITANKWRFKGS